MIFFTCVIKDLFGVASMEWTTKLKKRSPQQQINLTATARTKDFYLSHQRLVWCSINGMDNIVNYFPPLPKPPLPTPWPAPFLFYYRQMTWLFPGHRHQGYKWNLFTWLHSQSRSHCPACLRQTASRRGHPPPPSAAVVLWNKSASTACKSNIVGTCYMPGAHHFWWQMLYNFSVVL